MAEYRGDQCPARGAGLSHIVDGRINMTNRCVYCDRVVTRTPPEGVPDTATEAARGTVADHVYVFTIAGRCGHGSCGKLPEEHVTFLTDPGEDAECTVDHRSIAPWTACPLCAVVAEPRLFEGETTGPKQGPGRLPVTDRQKAVWERLHKAWVGGYYRS